MSSSRSNRDPHSVLGVGSNATKQEIRKAFRKLALKHHPDRNPGDAGAAARFREISEAYEALSGSKPKHNFKQPAHNAFHFDFGKPFNNFVFFDTTFDSWMNGAYDRGFRPAAQRGRNVPPDIDIAISISLEDAYAGSTKKVSYTRTSLCKGCDGTGLDRSSKAESCGICNGTGMLMRNLIVCSSCQGTGKASRPCGKCGGAGGSLTTVSENVAIPPRTAPYSAFSIPGKGNILTNSTGNLIVRVDYPKADTKSGVAMSPTGSMSKWIEVPWSSILAEGKIKFRVFPSSDEIELKLDYSKPDGEAYHFSGRGMSPSQPLVVKVIPSLPKNIKEEDRKALGDILCQYLKTK